MSESPFFTIAESKSIETLDDFFQIAKEKGSLCFSKDKSKKDVTEYNLVETAGIFRGQRKKLPLIPGFYRLPDIVNGAIDYQEFHSRQINLDLFCENAKNQNKDFPRDVIEQLILAQHYGIKTPLLDWTRNIFAAFYFATVENIHEKIIPECAGYIYHIVNDKILQKESLITNYNDIKNSILIESLPIDRRIERQSSCFTFHPHPSETPTKLKVNEYILTFHVVEKIHNLMKSTGMTSFYFFPDYSGIANVIKKGHLPF